MDDHGLTNASENSKLNTFQVESLLSDFGSFEDIVEVESTGHRVTYVAFDTQAEEYRTIYIFDATVSSKMENIDAIAEETIALSNIGFSGVERLYFASKVEGRLVIVAEAFQESITIDQMGKLPESVAAIIASKVAASFAGFSSANQNKDGEAQNEEWHNRLTPMQLTLSQAGEVIVRGFGYARHLQHEEDEIDSPYVAPDIIVGWRRDMFSIGVILYQMITGTTSYEGMEGIHDEQLQEIIQKATSSDNGSAYTGWQQMVDDLKLYIEGFFQIDDDYSAILRLFVSTGEGPSRTKNNKTKKGKVAGIVIGGFVLLAACLGAVWYFWFKGPEPRRIQPEPSDYYSIIIRNPEKLDGSINVDGIASKLISSQDETEIRVNSPGKHEVSITSEAQKPYNKNINLTGSEYIIDYPPVQYSIVFQYPIEAKDFMVEINYGSEKSKSLGKISEISNSRFTTEQGGKYKVILTDRDNRKPEYNPIIRTITLQRSQPEFVLKVVPVERKEYNVTISNPDNIRGEIRVNSGGWTRFSGIFQKSYETATKRSFTIRAPGYIEQSFVADFSMKTQFDFEYKPVSLVYTLIIRNAPIGGSVRIDDNPLLGKITDASETVFDDVTVKFGKEYKVTVKAQGYKDWSRSFMVRQEQILIDYKGITQLGSLQIKPVLSANLIQNTTMFLDDNPVSFSQKIDDIPLGDHYVSLVFKIGEYKEALHHSFYLSPGDEDHVWSLDVNLVTIDSNVSPTRLSIDGLDAGIAPRTIPFINKSIVPIIADPDNFDRKNETIEPARYAGKTFYFKFPTSERAEKLCSEARMIVDNFEPGDNINQLTAARIKLLEALSLNKDYPEALRVYFKLLSKRTEYSYNADKANDVLRLCEEANKLYLDGKSCLSNEGMHARILGYLVSINYFRAMEQTDSSGKKMMLDRCMTDFGNRYKENRRKIKSGNTNLDLYDKDWLDFHFALLCHEIWRMDSSEDNKKRVKQAWTFNPFHPYPGDSPGDYIDNPFKPKRTNYYQELL